MTERRRHVHDSVDDDRRSLERFLDVGLEDPCDVQPLDVVAVDLLGGIKTCLGVVTVGQQKVGRTLVGCVELLLSNWRNLRLVRPRLGFLLDFLRTGGRREQADSTAQCGASNRKSIHVSAPNIVVDVNRRILKKTRRLSSNLTLSDRFDKEKTPNQKG